MKTAVKLKGQEKVVNLIHLSTLEGEIKRYLILPDQTLTSCLIETIEILPRDSGQSIQFMTFNPVTVRRFKILRLRFLIKKNLIKKFETSELLFCLFIIHNLHIFMIMTHYFQGLLIVGTNERVYQVSKERCHRFNTKTLVYNNVL